MAPHSDWITALRLFELARTCAKQARRARTKAAKDQLKRMADEYLERAVKIGSACRDHADGRDQANIDSGATDSRMRELIASGGITTPSDDFGAN